MPTQGGERRFGCALCAILPPPGYLDRLAAKSFKNEKHSVEGHVRHHHPERLANWQSLVIELPRFRRVKPTTVARQPTRQDAVTPYTAATPGPASAFVTLKYRRSDRELNLARDSSLHIRNNSGHDISVEGRMSVLASNNTGMDNDASRNHDSLYDISKPTTPNRSDSQSDLTALSLLDTFLRRYSSQLVRKPIRIILRLDNAAAKFEEEQRKARDWNASPTTEADMQGHYDPALSAALRAIRKKIVTLNMDDFDLRAANGDFGPKLQSLAGRVFPLPDVSRSTMLYTGAFQAGIEAVRYLWQKCSEQPHRRQEIYGLIDVIEDLQM